MPSASLQRRRPSPPCSRPTPRHHRPSPATPHSFDDNATPASSHILPHRQRLLRSTAAPTTPAVLAAHHRLQHLSSHPRRLHLLRLHPPRSSPASSTQTPTNPEHHHHDPTTTATQTPPPAPPSPTTPTPATQPHNQRLLLLLLQAPTVSNPPDDHEPELRPDQLPSSSSSTLPQSVSSSSLRTSSDRLPAEFRRQAPAPSSLSPAEQLTRTLDPSASVRRPPRRHPPPLL